MKPISYSCFGVEEGSFLYKSFRYPAGEMQVRLTKDGFDMAKAEEIEFLIRIKTADDLVTLAHLKNAVDGVNPSGQKVLRLAYFPYARADRRFVDGDP